MSAASHTRRRRNELRGLKKGATHGDVASALELLSHSLELGHDRLALYRYYYASMLVKQKLAAYDFRCKHLASKIDPAVAVQIFVRAERALRSKLKDDQFPCAS